MKINKMTDGQLILAIRRMETPAGVPSRTRRCRKQTTSTGKPGDCAYLRHLRAELELRNG